VAHATTQPVVELHINTTESVCTAVNTIPDHNLLNPEVGTKINLPPWSAMALSVCARSARVALVGVAIDSTAWAARPALGALVCTLAAGKLCDPVGLAHTKDLGNPRSTWTLNVIRNLLSTTPPAVPLPANCAPLATIAREADARVIVVAESPWVPLSQRITI
jgi:hypothetical protein